MQIIRNIVACLSVALAVAWALWPMGALAQNLFAPAAKVDNAVITEFEVQQRARFLQFLNAPGADRTRSLEGLIDDRLRLNVAQAAGLNPTEDDVANAMAQFVDRTELTLDEFLAALQEVGIAAETFRDFVTVSAIWGEYIRARYGARVTISDAEIDRALAATGPQGSIRVLMSEIILPLPEENVAAVQGLADEISQLDSEAAFSDYATQVSAAPSRVNGGRIDWVPVANLPPALRAIVLGLTPGEVSPPLNIPGAIALFQLRDIAEIAAPAPTYIAIDYAAYYINGGRSPEALAIAERLRTRVDVCDDLYGVAKDQPPEVLDRGALPPSEIPSDIAFELAKLDPGEVSTALTRADGQTLVFLMLCGRTAEINEEAERGDIARQLRQERLSGYADTLLEQLRAEARIEIFQ